MFQYILYFLALLNPLALFVYLIPIKKDLGLKKFANILFRASIISFAIYALFSLSGEAIFTKVLKINFESFRVYGGIVLVAYALMFMLMGKQSMINTRGEINKIAAEVALPFIVGAGTITLSILMGKNLGGILSVLTIAIVLLINFLVVVLLAYIRYSLRSKYRTVLDRNLEILLRLNGFIFGAYGINLIMSGIGNFYGL